LDRCLHLRQKVRLCQPNTEARLLLRLVAPDLSGDVGADPHDGVSEHVRELGVDM
jgi:hypothetical protein